MSVMSAGWMRLNDADSGLPVRIRVEHVSALRQHKTHDGHVHVFVMTTGGSMIDVRDSLQAVEQQYELAIVNALPILAAGRASSGGPE
jgi:hypothetical protein